MRKTTTLSADYFENKYRANGDPWNFKTSSYEREKYASTLQALGDVRFERGLEIGCSIGVLTRQLAERCDELVAVDASEIAIAQARQNCFASGNIKFAVQMLPRQFPAGKFDLILLSEVLYYFDAADLGRVADQCVDALKLGGKLILCHWLGETNYPLSGNDASDMFAKMVSMKLPARSIVRDEVYRLERLSA